MVHMDSSMNRRRFLGGISALSVASLGLYFQTAEERINELETDVEELDNRVSALETQVADSSQGLLPPASDSATSASGEAPGMTMVEGAGTAVSEKFVLTPQRYRVDATITGITNATGFIVYLQGPSGSEDLLFNEFIQNAGTWEGAVTVTVTEGGEYFVEVTNTTAAWRLEFSPF